MNKLTSILFVVITLAVSAIAQTPSSPGGMALGPARFELEMKPGTETTVVVNLDYKAGDNVTQPARIVATLNDWTITKDGRVEYFPAGTQANSASPWLIYSPGEAAVTPGTIHQIRVTISVPANATPGDHLTALIIEQRPETLKYDKNVRQMIVKYRMASVFYIKVPGLTQKGDFGDLLAESTPEGIVVTPTLKNEGNSMIRPLASVKVLDTEGKVVADMPDLEPLPILGGAETKQPLLVAKGLPPGNYTVKYRVDFQDGKIATEGVTDLIVKAPVTQIAASDKTVKKP